MLTFSERQTLACALFILITITPHHPPSLLIEQLTYLVQGGTYLHSEDAPTLPYLPACPTAIPHDFWVDLHSIPLSTSYFSHCVTASAHSESDTDFWTGIEQGKEQNIAEFPWKKDKNEPDTLDDILFLNLIHEASTLNVISRGIARVTDSIPLSELLTTQDSDKKRRKPLLLLHDENQLASELNMLHLPEELQKLNQVSYECSLD